MTNTTQVGIASASDELIEHIKALVKDGSLSFTDLMDGPAYTGQDGKWLKANSGNGSSSMEWTELPPSGLNWTPQSTDVTGEDTLGYLASNGITITLPADPDVGTLVAIADHHSEFDANPVTVVASSGDLIEDDSELVLDLRNAYVQLIFDGDKWEIGQVSHPFNIQEITEENFPAGAISYTMLRTPPSRSSLLITIDGKVVPTSSYSVIANVVSFSKVTTGQVNIRHLGVPAANKVSDTPVGMLAYFPNNSPVDGWLNCDGGTINSSTYPDLVKYLARNESAETAVLPDARGNFIRTWDGGTGVDPESTYPIPADLSDNKMGSWIPTTKEGTSVNLWDGVTTTSTVVKISDGYIGYAFDAPVAVTSISLNCNDQIGTSHLPTSIIVKASVDGVTWQEASTVTAGGAALQSTTTNIGVTLPGEFRYWAVFGTGGTAYPEDEDYYWGVRSLILNGNSGNRVIGGFQQESVGDMDLNVGGVSLESGQVQAGAGSTTVLDGGTTSANGGGSETRPNNNTFVLKIKAFHYQSGAMSSLEVEQLREEVSALTALIS